MVKSKHYNVRVHSEYEKPRGKEPLPLWLVRKMALEARPGSFCDVCRTIYGEAYIASVVINFQVLNACVFCRKEKNLAKL